MTAVLVGLLMGGVIGTFIYFGMLGVLATMQGRATLLGQGNEKGRKR